jgi:hypothetical protein
MDAQEKSMGRTQTTESTTARAERVIEDLLKHHATAYETRENAGAKTAAISILKSKKRTPTASYAASGCEVVDAANLKHVAIVITKL